jgi:uncharacterized protein (DUF486 family)
LDLCRADSAFVLLQHFHDICLGEERSPIASAMGDAKRQWRFASDERAEFKRGAGGYKREGCHMTFAYLAPILLLCCSNVFMTFAWYGQLKFPTAPLLWVIPISWGIAFLEYCFAVPANRIGHQVYSAAQLKTMQEVITLIVFAIFSVTYLGEPLKWNHGVAFGLIVAAAYFAFHKF